MRLKNARPARGAPTGRFVMRPILISTLRGSLGFALTGLILFGALFGIDRQEQSHDDAPEVYNFWLMGEWQGTGGRIRYARFEPDNTFHIAPPGRGQWQSGTYTMTGAKSATLDPGEPWASVEVEGDEPRSGQLVVTGARGEIERLRWFRQKPPGPPSKPGQNLFWLLGLPFVAGTVGAAVLLFGQPHWVRQSLAFGMGAVPATFIVLFTLISLQGGGRPEYVWIATGCGIGLAGFGAFGGGCISLRLIIPGALCFGAAGAALSPIMVAGIVGGSAGFNLTLAILPFLIGGGLFGAAKALIEPDL